MADLSDIPDEAVTAELEEYATTLLLEHARDVEYLTVHEMAEQHLGREITDEEAKTVHEMVVRAELTVNLHSEAAALPVLNTATATCDEPMPVEGNAEEVQTCDHPGIPGTDRCPVHDPRHVEYLADLVAEIRQKDADLEEWRTGVLRLPVDRDSETATWLDVVIARLTAVGGPDVTGAVATLRSLVASLRGEQA